MLTLVRYVPAPTELSKPGIFEIWLPDQEILHGWMVLKRLGPGFEPHAELLGGRMPLRHVRAPQYDRLGLHKDHHLSLAEGVASQLHHSTL
jgi:hypothetical protein